ncbi:protein ALP1-like [Senna tora]|uniref:Protein ALP1-like n=1 Tax=Senna tora TaxID=362788 RepID=A0A834W931_9FABA|nr:protein ALP1-like [Senna tora]
MRKEKARESLFLVFSRWKSNRNGKVHSHDICDASGGKGKEDWKKTQDGAGRTSVASARRFSVDVVGCIWFVFSALDVMDELARQTDEEIVVCMVIVVVALYNFLMHEALRIGLCRNLLRGALDNTHVKVRVDPNEKTRFRNRKGDVTINVLGVCSQDAQFIYVLSGWEGSAADSRVLKSALSRPRGFKVPAGYNNAQGFLAPFRCQRYHLNEWRQGRHPTNPRECFNMRHSAARNVIERWQSEEWIHKLITLTADPQSTIGPQTKTQHWWQSLFL